MPSDQFPVTVEALEPRTLLAGNVNAYLRDGVLHVIGDASANAIAIKAVQPNSGQLRIDGQDTTVNGESASPDFTGVRQIHINLRGGDNSIVVDDVTRAHGLKIRTGGGDDTILMKSSMINGNLRIETHAGDDTLNTLDSSVIHSTHIDTSAGADVITFTRGGFLGRFLLEAGEGNDTVFHGTTFYGPKRILSGPGKDRISNSAINRRSVFYEGIDGWRAGFADYQTGHELQHDMASSFLGAPQYGPTESQFYLRSKPIDGEDIFMYLTRRFDKTDGLQPDTTYQVHFLVNFAIDNLSFCNAAAQCPDRSVYFKAGATSRRLRTVSRNGIERLNIDHGKLSGGGRDVSAVERLVDEGQCDLILHPPPTPVPLDADEPVLVQSVSDDVGVVYIPLQRTHIHTSLVKTDSRGRLNLIVGTASGYLGLTQVKYFNIQVRLIPIAAQEAAAQPTNTALRLVGATRFSGVRMP